MKKKITAVVAFLFLLLLAVPVWADGAAGQRTDYNTDYYMVVESRNGGIDIYAEASLDSGKLNHELVANGTALHIIGEKKDDSGRDWGLTTYHGMKGYVIFDELKPVTLEEAIRSELGSEGTKDVDYGITISAKDGEVNFYRGPGEKFGKAFSSAVKNGEKVHIEAEAKAEDGSLWGKVSGYDKQVWVNLDKASEVVRSNEATIHASTVNPAGVTPTATPEPTPEPTAAPTATPEPTPEPTAVPTAVPEPTAVPAASAEPTAVPVSPVVSPTPSTEPTVTAAPEEKAAEVTEPAQETSEVTEPAGTPASSENVDSESSPFKNPILWIVAVIVLLVLIFLYFLKLK